MIVIEAESGADRRLPVWRIDHREPGSDIRLLFWPIARFVIDLADGGEEQVIFEYSSLGRLRAPLQVPLAGVHGRRDLLTLRFIRGLQNAVPQPKGDRQVRTDTPRI